MKPIDEAFSSRGFRRVVMPGIVVTLGVHPIIELRLRDVMSNYGLSDSVVVLVAEIMVFGLLLSSATQWVYYVYEGFRLSWITWVAGWWNRRHLRKQIKRAAELKGTKKYEELPPEVQDKLSLIQEDLRDFPLRRVQGGQPERYVDRPTRIGNIITTYELYPRTRYGIDGVFYWFHLLGCAPDSTRQEFDDQYAFAESLVLTSFAGSIVALVNAIPLIGHLVGPYCDACETMSTRLGTAHPGAFVLFGLVVFLTFYRLALPVQREAGRMFRAFVDLGHEKFLGWVNTTPVPPDYLVVKRIRILRDYLDALIMKTEAPLEKG